MQRIATPLTSITYIYCIYIYIFFLNCCLTQTTMQSGITIPSSWGNFFMRLMHPSLWALQFAVQSSIHPRASWRWKKPWTPCRVQPHGRKVKHEWRFTCCRIWQNSWIGCMQWNVEITVYWNMLSCCWVEKIVKSAYKSTLYDISQACSISNTYVHIQSQFQWSIN